MSLVLRVLVLLFCSLCLTSKFCLIILLPLCFELNFSLRQFLCKYMALLLLQHICSSNIHCRYIYLNHNADSRFLFAVNNFFVWKISKFQNVADKIISFFFFCFAIFRRWFWWIFCPCSIISISIFCNHCCFCHWSKRSEKTFWQHISKFSNRKKAKRMSSYAKKLSVCDYNCNFSMEHLQFNVENLDGKKWRHSIIVNSYGYRKTFKTFSNVKCRLSNCFRLFTSKNWRVNKKIIDVHFVLCGIQ